MAINLPPLSARTVQLSIGAFAQVAPVPVGPHWLVIYATTADDGLVWVSTRDGIDGAANDATTVPDRRPLRPPCQFYLAPYQALAVSVSPALEFSEVTMEITPHPVQPVRSADPEPHARARCER